jgi:enoyl-CoA hydratase/carnithine racemase
MSIKTHTLNAVTTIEIARPDKKNALSLAMYDAMTHALAEASKDNAIRAVLIAGQPGVFTAGNDLEDFLANPPSGEESPVYRFMSALLGFEKPVVAAVTGTAVGIGVTMLLHCDLVYVSDDAKLSMPFVSLGLAPEFGSSFLLPLLIGHAKAAEKLMLAAPITATEAVALGLATASVPSAEVIPHARRAAERFNELPPDAVRETKRLLRAAFKGPVESAMRDESQVFLTLLRSPEAKKAFESFLQRHTEARSGKTPPPN